MAPLLVAAPGGLFPPAIHQKCLDRLIQLAATDVANGQIFKNLEKFLVKKPARKLGVEEFRRFVLVNNYVPLFFISGADGKAVHMFTQAHELVHVWLGSSTALDLRTLQVANEKFEQA
ncbi:hypothetical protein [Desulfosoma caldarium]|uniref:hypothetical protein n=1 Tax=Desulfosoma caldarium TaxID=610254 RepID=UPI000F4756E6|nr:hypothetical protein [Desulfosoma caldarium]